MLAFLLIPTLVFAGATFSRIKTWNTGDSFTASDINSEFDNILNNFNPDGMDDTSENASAMQSTSDPYPGDSISLPTDLTGEIKRLRYMIRQITGETYWYIDPDIRFSGATSTKGDLLYFDGSNYTVLSAGTTGLYLQTRATSSAPQWVGVPGIMGVTRGLVIRNTSGATTTQVDINADEIMLQASNSLSKIVTSTDITINSATSSQINALDTGTVSTDTWYYIWVLNGTSGTGGVISTASTTDDVTKPTGYQAYSALVGAIRKDSSGDFEGIIKTGDRTQYTNVSVNQRILNTTGTTSDWTSLTIRGVTTTVVPNTARIVYGYISIESSNDNKLFVAPNNTYSTDFTSASNAPPAGVIENIGWSGAQFSFLLESNNLYYHKTASGGSQAGRIWIIGWED